MKQKLIVNFYKCIYTFIGTGKNVFQNIWAKNDLKTKIALISVIFVPLSMQIFECMAVEVLSVIAYVYSILYIATDVKNITFKESSFMSAAVLLGYTMAMVTAFSACEMSVMNYPKIWETDNNLIFYMRILLIIVLQFLGPYFYTFFLLQKIPTDHAILTPIRGLIWSLLVYLISSHTLFYFGIIDQMLLDSSQIIIRDYMDLPKCASVVISYISLDHFEEANKNRLPGIWYMLHLILPIMFVGVFSGIPKYKDTVITGACNVRREKFNKMFRLKRRISFADKVNIFVKKLFRKGEL